MTPRPEQLAMARKERMGRKLDAHCPYDEATLREDLLHGEAVCPICWTHLKIPEHLKGRT